MSASIHEKDLMKMSYLFKVISDPTRIQILYVLKNESENVTNLVLKLGMTQSAISHQLRVLKDANLVKAQRKGKEIFYSLSDDHVHTIFEQALEHIVE